MSKKVMWVGGAIATVTNGLSLVKLATHFLEIGLVGVPNFILSAYAEFVAEIRHWLLEVPFDLTPPEWVMHFFIVWSLFSGSNYRFLTYSNNGETLGQRLSRGIGDMGRGVREPLSGWKLRLASLLVSLTGPLFSGLVLTMWLGNRRGGPASGSSWGDHLMIGNRGYTVKISKIYLLILSLAPIAAALIIAWGAAGTLSKKEASGETVPPNKRMQLAARSL